MTAWQRSHITERSEKGIGPISFKRLLIAGASGGIVAMLAGRTLGFFPGCLSAGLALAAVLAATHPVEGLPLFAFGFRSAARAGDRRHRAPRSGRAVAAPARCSRSRRRMARCAPARSMIRTWDDAEPVRSARR